MLHLVPGARGEVLYLVPGARGEVLHLGARCQGSVCHKPCGDKCPDSRLADTLTCTTQDGLVTLQCTETTETEGGFYNGMNKSPGL